MQGSWEAVFLYTFTAAGLDRAMGPTMQDSCEAVFSNRVSSSSRYGPWVLTPKQCMPARGQYYQTALAGVFIIIEPNQSRIQLAFWKYDLRKYDDNLCLQYIVPRLLMSEVTRCGGNVLAYLPLLLIVF